MNLKRIVPALVATAAACAMSGVVAGDPTVSGQNEYERQCASCHGVKGRGDGPAEPYLTKSRRDLTTLACKNGGVFPYDRVYAIVDGREAIAAHRPHAMPVCGREYGIQAAEYFIDVPYDSECYVQERIAALCEYVGRLQVKELPAGDARRAEDSYCR